MAVRVADPAVNEGGMLSLSVNDTRPKILWLMNLSTSLVLVGNGGGEVVGSFTDWPASVRLVDPSSFDLKGWSSHL